jgi:hypothetical protein
VPEQTPEARIRDLERRLDLDPGSRLFVSLAEEYRKVGRIKDALSALQKGLLAHPGYVAAQVALGRVYVEAKQTTDAIATFTKVLQADPGNLVAARSLADIYHERGDNLEALKKYKLYRALSGDRKVDELIAKIEPKVAPLPITPLKKIINTAEPPPPPPSFQDTHVARSRPTMTRLPVPPPSELSDPFDVTSLSFDPGEDSTGKGAAPADGPFSAIPTRDVFIAPPTSGRSRKESSRTAAPSEAPAAAAPAPPVPEPPPPPPPLVEAPPAAPAVPMAAAEPAPPPEGDPEQTLSVRRRREEEAAPEPSEEREPGDLFAPERPAPDLPEPPALFITPAPEPATGEARVPPPASLEPREFPPPYEEEPAAPAVPAAPVVAAPAVSAAPFFAGGEEVPAAGAPGVPAAAAFVEPVFPGDVAAGGVEAAAAPFGFAGDEPPARTEAAPISEAPTGRALADLYYAQGHYAEALQIYDDLVTRHPFDDDLKRMRRDAEARLLPAASAPYSANQDAGLERRLARVRVLKRWLGRIQTSGGPSAAPGP